MSKTALANNSNLNKAHDTWIQTYKHATTNNPDTTKFTERERERERERGGGREKR